MGSNSLAINEYFNKLKVNHLKVNQLKVTDVVDTPVVPNILWSMLGKITLTKNSNNVNEHDYEMKMGWDDFTHLIMYTDRPYRLTESFTDIDTIHEILYYLFNEDTDKSSFSSSPPNVIISDNIHQKSFNIKSFKNNKSEERITLFLTELEDDETLVLEEKNVVAFLDGWQRFNTIDEFIKNRQLQQNIQLQQN